MSSFAKVWTLTAKLLAAIIISASAGALSAAKAETIVLKAGYLIDPISEITLVDQIIVIENGRIKEIGKNLGIPHDARVVDLTSKWVLPGLMDLHTHLTLNFKSGEKFDFASKYATETSAYRALRGARNARLMLNAGFTTIRDVGNSANFAMVDVRRAISEGLTRGPDIIDAGKIIAPFGGQTPGVSPEHTPTIWDIEYIDADTPDEMRKAVRKNIYYGATAIKLVSDASSYYISKEEMEAAVDEAHSAGLTVAVHVMGGEAATIAIEAGVDSIEHGFMLSKEQLVEMKKRGIYLVGTEFPVEHLRALGVESLGDPALLADAIVKRLELAHSLGTPLAFGTDVFINIEEKNRAQMTQDYFAIWAAAGIPKYEIIKALTYNAADMLNLSEDRGRIATGYRADIIAVDGNPIEDIRLLKSVDFVMKNGHIEKPCNRCSGDNLD